MGHPSDPTGRTTRDDSLTDHPPHLTVDGRGHPAGLAARYRDAAQRIRTCGYDAATVTGDYEGSHGISITTALRRPADTYGAQTRGEDIFGPYTAADAADLAEELETRLAAVLYLTGQLTYRTAIRDLSDRVAAWESELPRVEGS
jgi:hypothetical protein